MIRQVIGHVEGATHPSFVTGDTVHLIDETSEQSAKGTSSGSGTEEESDPEVDLVASVPLGQEEGDSREKTCKRALCESLRCDRDGYSASDLPASVIPKNTRVTSNPSKLRTKPIPIMTPPQANMMEGSHIDGL